MRGIAYAWGSVAKQLFLLNHRVRQAHVYHAARDTFLHEEIGMLGAIHPGNKFWI